MGFLVSSTINSSGLKSLLVSPIAAFKESWKRNKKRTTTTMKSTIILPDDTFFLISRSYYAPFAIVINS